MIDNTYDFGQIVYLKTDVEQLPRQIYEIRMYKGGEIMYGVRQGENSTSHFGYELNDQVDESVKIIYPMDWIILKIA